MKRIEILSHTFVRKDKEQPPEPVFVGSVIEVDDEIAGETVVSGRAKYVDGKTKLRDTSGEYHALADEAAAKAQAPAGAELATMVANAVAQAIAAAMASKPAQATGG